MSGGELGSVLRAGDGTNDSGQFNSRTISSTPTGTVIMGVFTLPMHIVCPDTKDFLVVALVASLRRSRAPKLRQTHIDLEKSSLLGAATNEP